MFRSTARVLLLVGASVIANSTATTRALRGHKLCLGGHRVIPGDNHQRSWSHSVASERLAKRSSFEYDEAEEPNTNMSFRENWETQAAGWASWARDPEQDHFFWSFNLPCFLGFLPKPGGLTVDIGCGEGRLARALVQAGHSVLALDSSPALVRLAAEQRCHTVLTADAAQLPIRHDVADLAVCFMVLMDVDDLDHVIQEANRILKPDGELCMAIIHPMHSARWGTDASYFVSRPVDIPVTQSRVPVTFHTSHRSLGEYFRALERAGLAVTAIAEPTPNDEYVRRYPSVAPFSDRPSFLYIRARKSLYHVDSPQ